MTLLSIVTGTYNRLDFLRGMVTSVRQQMPLGLEYEFVIVDGGSTDGTLDWCRAQVDVHLLEHGELRGAIRAFCDGARAAQGDFVVLANDDILFHDGGLVRALAYLDSHPTCGAVAFADDRPVAGYGSGYKVQFVPAIAPDGQSVSVPYAQVGMFRRALGDAAGWWGDHDAVMREARTYGGDNYLSARLWELGFSVDAVPGCAVDDRIPQDALRAANVAHDAPLVSPYHRRFPNGPQIARPPAGLPDEHLRVLYLPLYSAGYGPYKRGLREALGRVGWVYELDYQRQASRVATAVSAFQPHLLLTQFHNAEAMPSATLAYLRGLCPQMLVVNWNGDVYLDQLTSPGMLDLLRHVDLQLVVNADALPVYEAAGVTAGYWQIGFEPVPDALPVVPSHRLLFMANAYSPARKELGAVLRDLDKTAGLYGYGWDRPSGNSFYDFAQGAALYRNCRIAIGDNQYGDKGFVSNRLFEALANGAFLLHQAIPGLEELTGLVDGVHYVSWRDDEDLRDKVRHYLASESERQKIAAAGEAFVRAKHSFDARVRELFEVLLPRIGVSERADA